MGVFTRPFFAVESFSSVEDVDEAHTSLESALEQAEGLVFDCDGTLLDTMPMYYESWSRVCAELGLKLSMERFYSFAGMSVRDIFDVLINEQKPNDQDRQITKVSKDGKITTITLNAEYCEQLKRHHAKQVSSVAGHAEAIDVVVDIVNRYHKKIPMAVASSGWRDHVVEGLERVGILDKFDAIVTADDPAVQHAKPAPDIFLVAAERMNVSPSKCVGFEDADFGMQALNAAGYLHGKLSNDKSLKQCAMPVSSSKHLTFYCCLIQHWTSDCSTCIRATWRNDNHKHHDQPKRALFVK